MDSELNALYGNSILKRIEIPRSLDQNYDGHAGHDGGNYTDLGAFAHTSAVYLMDVGIGKRHRLTALIVGEGKAGVARLVDPALHFRPIAKLELNFRLVVRDPFADRVFDFGNLAVEF